MYSFGKTSTERLNTCHPDIIKIMNEVIKYHDISVLEGIRSLERQQKLFKDGKSQLDGIIKVSEHQDKGDGLSHAIDIMPYYKGFNPFTSENGAKTFYYLAGLVQSTAQKLYDDGEISHLITWGGNWDNDMDFFGDSQFFDLPHFQLRKV